MKYTIIHKPLNKGGKPNTKPNQAYYKSQHLKLGFLEEGNQFWDYMYFKKIHQFFRERDRETIIPISRAKRKRI
jgi:hypothetical protein